MILVDSNVWVSLTATKHDLHGRALAWLKTQSSPRSILFCRATQQSFLRLLTTEAVMRSSGMPRLTNAEAWTAYDRARSDARVGFADEPDHLEEQWKQFANRESASPKLWMDAYLAAFAVAAEMRFVTADKGFSQFRGLKLVLL